MRMLRLIAIGTLLIATACTGAAASSTTSPIVVDGTPPPPPVIPVPGTCPHSLPYPLPRHAMPGVGAVMVPSTPGALVICIGQIRTVVDPQRLPRLVRKLNHLKRVQSPHIFACPVDFGPTYALFFDYADGTRLLVTVDASGCRFATNGRITGFATTSLLQTLRHLVA